MLNSVPASMRTAARNMVLRHPNAIRCTVMRRSVTRTTEAEAGIVGGELSLGGIGTLGADDEPEVNFQDIGEARVLFVGVRPPTSMTDNGDASEAEAPTPMEAMVEPMMEGAFTCKDADLLMLRPGAGVVITFEVLRQIAQVHIPPYVTKFEIQAQMDMTHIPSVAAAVAAAR
jgi:hypothetical protein